MIIEIWQTDNKKNKIQIVSNVVGFSHEYFLDDKLVSRTSGFLSYEAAEIELKNQLHMLMIHDGLRYKKLKRNEVEIENIREDPNINVGI